MTTIDSLPLDCIRMIALESIPVYRAMLMIRRFALTTLGPANIKIRDHFTVRTDIEVGDHRTVYSLNDMIHRDHDLPAVIWIGLGCRDWIYMGMAHRDNDRPAEIWKDGSLYWHYRGKRHRDGDKPATIRSNGTREWWKDDKRHRDGGLPAVIYPDGEWEWWMNGINILTIQPPYPYHVEPQYRVLVYTNKRNCICYFVDDYSRV
jgi:hypothetical protein